MKQFWVLKSQNFPQVLLNQLVVLCLVQPAGFKTWQRTVDVYVQQLCRQQNFLKAASHLLSLNRVYEALELLKTHRFYR